MSHKGICCRRAPTLGKRKVAAVFGSEPAGHDSHARSRIASDEHADLMAMGISKDPRSGRNEANLSWAKGSGMFRMFSNKKKRVRYDGELASSTGQPILNVVVGATARDSGRDSTNGGLLVSNSISSIPPPSVRTLRYCNSILSSSASTDGLDDDPNILDELRCRLVDITDVKLESSLSLPHKDDRSSSSDDSSLLKSSSDEDDEMSLQGYSSEPQIDLFSILQDFEKRDRQLQILVAGRAASYRAMIFTREVAARHKILQDFCEQQRAKAAADSSPLQTRNLERNTTHTSQSGFQEHAKHSPLLSLKHLILFECHHSFEGSFFATLYCFGHVALFSLVELSITTALSSINGLTPYRLHTMVMVVALLMMRFNGYLWSWLSLRSWEHVKFDMHNRRVLGYWDAHLLTCFRQGVLSRIKPLISIIAFYMLFLSVMFFYFEMYFIWAARFRAIQRFLPWGCDAFAEIQYPTLLTDIWQYSCLPPGTPGLPEPVLPQVIFYFLSTSLATVAMAKSQVALFQL